MAKAVFIYYTTNLSSSTLLGYWKFLSHTQTNIPSHPIMYCICVRFVYAVFFFRICVGVVT